MQLKDDINIVIVPRFKRFSQCFVCNPNVEIDDNGGFFLCDVHYGTYGSNPFDFRVDCNAFDKVLFYCLPITFTIVSEINELQSHINDNLYNYIEKN